MYNIMELGYLNALKSIKLLVNFVYISGRHPQNCSYHDQGAAKEPAKP